jgi:hypothetical protein
VRFFYLSFALAFSACAPGPQQLVDTCLTSADLCPPCDSHDDCVIVSNLCHESASCVHADSNFAVTQDGCSLEHEPPEEVCACVSGVCRAERTFCAIPEGCPN